MIISVGIIRILITSITSLNIKFVYCPFCSSRAIVKSNKKNKKMLKCDLCYALIFANGQESQQHLLNLPEYREYY